jgi:ferredoxin
MSTTQAFIRTFGIPPALAPHADLIATTQEQALIVGLADQDLTAPEVSEMLDLPTAEAETLLTRAFKREMVERTSREGVTTYTAGTFYPRMDIWISFEHEDWRRLPQETRDEAHEWHLQEFMKLWGPAAEKIRRDPDAWVRIKNRDLLLLEEALELVEASPDHAAVPCACQAILCPESEVFTASIRLGARARLTIEKEQGRAIDAAEAKALVIEADRRGLTHTGYRYWRRHDPDHEWQSFGQCNPFWSYPFKAGRRLGLEKRWPRAHHVAVLDGEACTHCGRCIERCPFDAFHRDTEATKHHGEDVLMVHYDAERCWGCGLCATGCPEAAITMEALT